MPDQWSGLNCFTKASPSPKRHAFIQRPPAFRLYSRKPPPSTSTIVPITSNRHITHHPSQAYQQHCHTGGTSCHSFGAHMFEHSKVMCSLYSPCTYSVPPLPRRIRPTATPTFPGLYGSTTAIRNEDGRNPIVETRWISMDKVVTLISV